MRCPICEDAMRFCFDAKVLKKYQARFEVCQDCGYLRASDPHWLGEAYSSAIAAADTGLVARNIAIAVQLSSVLYWATPERGRGLYLDAAGGYGMLTRLMRDNGFNFYWSDKHCSNVLAPQFEYRQSFGECNAVTAIEVMEHLTDPLAFVHDTLMQSRTGSLFFTTQLYQGEVPAPQEWWYYTFATGQHIGFFQHHTLDRLAQRLGLTFASHHGLHAFSRRPLDLKRFHAASNPWLARIGTPWIRRQLGSKTVKDHEVILNSVNDRVI